jgi:hypothetical protein
MAQTLDSTPLDEAEIRSFVRKVYRELFDTHAPLDAFLASLDDDELEMRFPEETVRGHAGFQPGSRRQRSGPAMTPAKRGSSSGRRRAGSR